MFGLSESVSTIIISIISLLMIASIIFPNIFKLRKKIWLSIQVGLILLCVALIIVFSDAGLDTYYYLGSFLGAGFLIKGALTNDRTSLVFFLCSFLSFSLVFLSIGQIIFFIICICYVYLLMIGTTVFLLLKDKAKLTLIKTSKETQLISFVLLLALPIIAIYILVFLSQNAIISYEPISLYELFSQNYEILAILIVFFIFLVIMILIFVIDFKRNKDRSDDPWFT